MLRSLTSVHFSSFRMTVSDFRSIVVSRLHCTGHRLFTENKFTERQFTERRVIERRFTECILHRQATDQFTENLSHRNQFHGEASPRNSNHRMYTTPNDPVTDCRHCSFSMKTWNILPIMYFGTSLTNKF